MMNFKRIQQFLIFFLNICFIPVFAQIQTVDLPQPGFKERIEKAVDDMWIADTHEHLLMEDNLLKQKAEHPFDFSHLFVQYISDDLASAGYISAVDRLVKNPSLSYKERWQIFEPFWNATKNTGYARVVIIAARDLYGIDDINAETVETLSDRINSSYQPGWYKHVLKVMAKIEFSIVDVGHIRPDPEFYYHVERFDDFISVFSGGEIKALGKKYGIPINSLDDYVSSLRKAFDEGIDYAMVGVKTALAYQRPIYYENTGKDTAERLFNMLLQQPGDKGPEDFATVKPLQDYMMHRVLDLAAENDLPVQIHTGLFAGGKNEIRNSQPTLLTNLFNEYPAVKFCIFHSSYPYGEELSVLAKNYPNVFIDMCWTDIISPSYSERFLHEWLETVPANKIMAFGGDYGHVESAYAHSVMARKVVAKVLVEKVADGYFSEQDAIVIANRLLRDNAMEIFKLKGKSRDLDALPALSSKGIVHDLWELVKTEGGLVRDWMVIGPFPLGTGVLTDDAPPGFTAKFPPEDEIKFEKSYPGDDGPVSWQKVKAGKSGVLDFKQLFPQGKAIVYAYAEVESPDERTMQISFGSDDGAKIWINGGLVYNVHAWRAMQQDGDIFEVKLKKGKNTILVKVEDKWLAWEMMMRLIDVKREVGVREW
jgi:uncharacterized protein